MQIKSFILVFTLVFLVSLTALIFTGPPSDASHYDYNLGLGGRVFWPEEPENVDQASVPDSADCNEPGTDGPCRYYRLKVAEGGARLRVTFGLVLQNPGDVRNFADSARSVGDQFRMELFAPPEPGQTLGRRVDDGDNRAVVGINYAFELEALNPAPGIWTVRVVPVNVDKLAYRLRAKLETEADVSATPEPGEPVPLSPNLRIIPPFEFNFNTVPGSYTGGTYIPGVHPSCMPEEVREALTEEEIPPKLCLRFSMGLENVGNGPLRFVDWTVGRPNGLTPPDEPLDPAEKYMTQQRFYTNLSVAQRWKSDEFGRAGRARLDPSHGHYHWRNAWKFELYRVATEGWRWPEDRHHPPVLEQPLPGRKSGLNGGNEHLVDWFRFYPVRDWSRFENSVNPQRVDCQNPTGEPSIFCRYEDSLVIVGSLDPSWGDIYEWNRGGNYVDFPFELPVADGDSDGDDLNVPRPKEGHYLIRGTADPEDNPDDPNDPYFVIETNEQDNVSYALIHVNSDATVLLLERGYGKDSWDPRRKVLTESP